MRRHLSEYGMLATLLALCVILSLLTISEETGTSATNGGELGEEILREVRPQARIVIIAGDSKEEVPFVDALARALTSGSATVVAQVQGSPQAARSALEQLAKDNVKVDAVAASASAARWAVLEDISNAFPSLGRVPVFKVQPSLSPIFLKVTNLRNIADQIAIIAILAVGMTLVIITGGIDLSVGSMIALAAVVSALMVRDLAGAREASQLAMILSAAAAVGVCAALGLVNGSLVTFLRVPPFIATLGMMLVARGLARLLSQETAIYELPASSLWLGRGTDLFGIPNAVVLMLCLFGAAHILMTRTVLGRYIYAVGGNPEAARLSGVPVQRVLLLVYALCGALAGLGGIVTVSLFQSAAPTYGEQYELYVVAAVVVGGTSISGGEGKMSGTLIGAFIIAVIRNGMNLMGIQSAMQMVVLGTVIVAAVAIDRVKGR